MAVGVHGQELISREFMSIIDMAMRLGTIAFLVQDSDLLDFKGRLGLEILEVFQDGVGLTSVSSNLVAKHDGNCYGVFRGTFLNPQDWFQNLDVLPHTVGGCSVHGGLDDNYGLVEKERFDQSLLDCIRSCQDGDCPLIFTGISQGGGTAALAPLYWPNQDPTVITFGAPAAIYTKDCNGINDEKHFRFWNTQNIAGSLTYDVVNNLNLLGTHYGRSYLLFDDAPPVYLGLNDNSERLPTSLSAHGGYQSRINQLNDLDVNVFPLDTTQNLPTGYQCGYNDECGSGKCSVAGRCSVEKNSNGEGCNEDSDCASGICAIHNLALVGLCTGGSSGDVCVYNDDCNSGTCTWSFRCM